MRNVPEGEMKLKNEEKKKRRKTEGRRRGRQKM